MKEKYAEYDKYYIVDYCKYSDFGYQKRTRFWTNIEGFTPKLCKKDCENMLNNTKEKTQKLHVDRLGNQNTLHKYNLGSWGKVGTDQRGVGCGSNRFQRFRIPFKLINELLLLCYSKN